MKRIVSGAIALVLIASLGLASCTSVVEAKTGTIEVRVTDAPAGYEIEEIWVKVSEEEGEGVAARRAVDDGDGEWETIDILEGKNPFELTQFAQPEPVGGLDMILAVAEVPAGKYTQIRMNIEWVKVTYTYLEDGEPKVAADVVAKLPSDNLKFVRPFDVVAGETTTLLLDFIADKSVVVTGNGKVIFKPVVTLAIQQGGKPHQLATVEGTISALDTEGPDLSVSITPDVGDEIVLIVNPQTEITLDGFPAILEDLAVGQGVTAYYYLNNLKATQIDALSPPLE